MADADGDEKVREVPLMPAPRTTGRYVGTARSGLDVFFERKTVEVQATVVKTRLTVQESRELRRLLEIAELGADHSIG